MAQHKPKNVKELIEVLSQYPRDMPVVVDGWALWSGSGGKGEGSA